ncbi:NADH:flavin oxidoreductase/NADH oxidase [Nemorincola caseinilytica]|uniref:NADH:flavin oxidoreductase/NADH oxidase n=1 Tax=Nemorincola caseinilytica TaxID=2054315 RepID=A0ABP8NF34_9BACT
MKNRIVVSPMCQYSGIDGFANDWHLVHLGSRAVGGAGLVFTEATAVTPEGRISPYDLGLWDNEHITFLRRITSFIEAQGSVPGIQLAHAGRKSSLTTPWNGDRQLTTEEGAWDTLGPTALAFSPDRATPQELTTDGIERIITAFAHAAKRALTAGFKVLEIHGAHGYLINEFLSPLSNRRTDEYGGSFDDRIRFLMRIIEAVREVWPQEYPLFLRISASDWVDGGWTTEDSARLAPIVKQAGVDLIDCSSGGNSADARIPAKPGYQVPFAEAVRKAGIPTGAVGIIVTPQQAEDILAAGQADLIFMAREFLRDPYFPLHAATALDHDMRWPVQYERAKRKK